MSEDLIFGRNSVMEALRSDREIDCIMVSKGAKQGSINKIIAMAREKKLVIKTVADEKLNTMTEGANHQGVAAIVAAASYCTLDDILNLAKEKGEPPFIILCDEIEDPHNLGAIIRTAEGAGAHGVVIPKRRSAGLNGTVAKTSAGAVEHMLVAKVPNIASAMDELQKQGLWIYGADMDGECYCSSDLTGPIGLVVGSEGFGMSKVVREKCDFVLSLPMLGKVNSLNASVASGILMYEITRQRLGLKAKQPKG